MKRIACTATLAAVLGSASIGHSAIIISEIDFAGGQLELVNTGLTDVSLAGWQLCNFIGPRSAPGSNRYRALSTQGIDLAASTATSNTFLAAGQILVVNLTAGYLSNVSGELGLYRNTGFSSGANIEDYLSWGASGNGRDDEAASVGLWINNDFVNTSGGVTSGNSLQRLLGTDGTSSTSYGIASSNIGVPQSVPEPATGTLGAAGAMIFLARRRRRD